MTTGFFWDEKCFWHAGGNYALTLPLGGLVQPLVGGGLPESPETKRRLKNLLDVTGLSGELMVSSAPQASEKDLRRVHPAAYLKEFKDKSDAGGGELGLRTPFIEGGYEIAALSAGLAKSALSAVLNGTCTNAYALSRPPGHHCLPDWPNGFCLMANIAIAIEAAKAEGLAGKVAVVDWDVHHGNGTEAIYYERDDVLTISLHQEKNYPLDKGDVADRGAGKGAGHNINVPLPPGAGHDAYLYAMEQIVLPALADYAPDVIIVACGFDACIYDPLARMMATAETYKLMTKQMMGAADALCGGKLVMVHEGGYSEAYVPFCGHAVIETLAGSSITAPDPMAETVHIRQPNAKAAGFFRAVVDDIAAELTGTATLGPAPNDAALGFLAMRRSRTAKTLKAPAPDAEQLNALLTIGARTPDHGKLEPWRYVVLSQDKLRGLALLAEARATAEGLDEIQTAKAAQQFKDGLLAVAVIEVQKPSPKVPAIEQSYSAGAVCLSLLNAALAAGWGANWLSGWASHDRGFVEEGLGLAAHERVAGLIHIASQSATPPERPRPDIAEITTWL